MPLLILAMLLTIVQTSPPVPRKATDTPASRSQNTKRDTKSHKKPPAKPQTIQESPTPKTSEQEGDNVASNNEQQPVRIGELPPVSVKRDWIDCLTLFFGGALVIIGGIGVRLALRTLNAIKRQADLMEGSIHVDGVRVIEFLEERRPIFFVKIVNSGMIAKEVSITMKVDIGANNFEFPRSQKLIIPAQGNREFPIFRAAFQLQTGALPKLDGGEMDLRVSGQIAWEKKAPVPYCYKYNPWPFGDRPPELPSFVTCEFDTGIGVSAIAKVKGVSGTVRLGKVTASVDNPPADDPKEPDDQA